MKMNTKYFLELEADEALALIRLLGKISDVEYRVKFNLSAKEINYMHDLYQLLPIDED